MLGLKWESIKSVRGFNFVIIMYLVMYILFLSSPYLCVFDDDHVTRYVGADIDVGEHANT